MRACVFYPFSLPHASHGITDVTRYLGRCSVKMIWQTGGTTRLPNSTVTLLERTSGISKPPRFFSGRASWPFDPCTILYSRTCPKNILRMQRIATALLPSRRARAEERRRYAVSDEAQRSPPEELWEQSRRQHQSECSDIMLAEALIISCRVWRLATKSNNKTAPWMQQRFSKKDVEVALVIALSK